MRTISKITALAVTSLTLTGVASAQTYGNMGSGQGTLGVLRSTEGVPPATMPYVSQQPQDSYTSAPDTTPESASEAVRSQLPQTQTQGNVSYVTGGVGDGELEALERGAHNFNLRVMQAEKDGSYISDSQIIISGKNGEVLNVTPDGPMLYANLPAGSYTVTAAHEGKTQKRNVTVGKKSPQKINFYW